MGEWHATSDKDLCRNVPKGRRCADEPREANEVSPRANGGRRKHCWDFARKKLSAEMRSLPHLRGFCGGPFARKEVRRQAGESGTRGSSSLRKHTAVGAAGASAGADLLLL